MPAKQLTAALLSAALLVLCAESASAQTYAPAPRALAPVAPAPTDVCAPAPLGQGGASAACRQECSRNARYSPHCAPSAASAGPAPNWGAPAAAGSSAAQIAAPAAIAPAVPAGTGSAGPSAVPAQPGRASPSSGSVRSAPTVTRSAPKMDAPRTGAVTPGVGQAAGSGGAAMGGGTPTQAVAPALVPQASSALPGSPSPARGAAANSVARLGCGPHLAMGGEPYFSAVDGRTQGVVFTPGRTFTLQGCGFGERKGTVALNGSSGMSNLLLLVQSWNDTTIVAQVDQRLGGVMDQAQVEVVVTRNDGRRLQQAGHMFEAARETIKLVSVPPGVLTREGPNLVRPKPKTVSPAPSGATLLVDTPPYSPKTQFCPTEPNRDVLALTNERLPLRNGFVIDRVVGRDLTNRDWERGDHGEDGGYEWHRQNAFTVENYPPYAQIVPSWMGLYRKRDALRDAVGVLSLGAVTAATAALEDGKLSPGSSLCWSAYELDVYVKGPRGLAAF